MLPLIEVSAVVPEAESLGAAEDGSLDGVLLDGADPDGAGAEDEAPPLEHAAKLNAIKPAVINAMILFIIFLLNEISFCLSLLYAANCKALIILL